MRRAVVITAVLLVVAGGLLVYAGEHGPNTYKVTATAIEACSCPLFCSCYYNAEPTGGHMCQFNNAYRFEDGSHWGGTDLSGALLWVSGDLGSHFADGTTEWATVTFDKRTTPEQRQAIGAWMAKVFPVEWAKVEMREDTISWEDHDATAHAKMESGMAEIELTKVKDKRGEQATVTNTAYWGSDSNTGFRLAHSKHHFDGDPSYSYEGRNGFMITISSEGEIPAATGE